MRTFDRDAELVRELGGAAGMIDMAVGEQDLLDRDPRLVDRLEDRVDIAARIDDGADAWCPRPR